MMKLIRKLFILILTIIILTAFNSSYTALNVDNLAVVVALGIDSSDNNSLKVSFQFTNASSVSESGSTESASSIIYSINASSISSAINLMNTYIGKEINLSHCKLVVFSEELAMKGISNEIYTLTNDAQIRPATNIVISKCSAKYYIENSKPLLENLLTKYYEVFSNSSEYTGYTSNATIGEFFNSIICNSCEPYAILGGISSEKGDSSTSINSQKDSSGKSNESPLEGQSGAENSGLAVFKGASLVGELNSIETLSFLATRNEIKQFLISVPNPEKEGAYLDISLTPLKNTKIDVKIVNGSPFIKLNYKFTGQITSMQENSDYLSPELLEKVSSSCNNYLQSIFSNYLYRSSKELKSDINGIGKTAKSKFLTTKDFSDYNWNEKYKDSFFDVSVDTSIKSSFLLNET